MFHICPAFSSWAHVQNGPPPPGSLLGAHLSHSQHFSPSGPPPNSCQIPSLLPPEHILGGREAANSKERMHLSETQFPNLPVREAIKSLQGSLEKQRGCVGWILTPSEAGEEAFTPGCLCLYGATCTWTLCFISWVCSKICQRSLRIQPLPPLIPLTHSWSYLGLPPSWGFIWEVVQAAGAREQGPQVLSPTNTS